MGKALVVDDEEDLRELIVMGLEDIGLECFEASNITDAFVLYKENKPNIIISDVHMPNGSGFELIENIRHENDQIPVVLLLTDPDPEDELLVKKLNITHVYAKPFNIYEISKEIKGFI